MKKFTKQELFISIGLVLLGILLLVYRLDLPLGFHGDEAGNGLEARRILQEGSIGVWSPAVMGGPAFPYYITALFFKLLGEGISSARLSHSLLVSITLPFFYLTTRLILSRQIAVIATFLLLTSDLFLALSRRADFMSVNFSFFPALFFFLYSFKTNRTIYFILAGIFVGLSHYMYFSFWITPIAFILFIIVKIVIQPRFFLSNYGKNLLILIISYMLITYPLFSYGRNHPEEVFEKIRATSILQPDGLAYARTYIPNNPSSVEVFFYNVKKTLPIFIFHGDGNLWNSFRYKPAFDSISGILFILGFLLGLKYIFKTQIGFLYFLFFFFLIPNFTTIDSPSFRKSQVSIYLGYIFIALCIKEIYLFFHKYLPKIENVIKIVLLLITVSIGAIHAYLYFTEYAISKETKITLSYNSMQAANYIHSLPKSTYVYFYSSTGTINHEIYKFLAPNLLGEDRSNEFGKYSLTRNIFDKNIVYILLPDYFDRISELENLYPGGKRVDHNDNDGTLLFISYFLPSKDGSMESI